ncbi:helix-turn-helix transcriptional regulator [Novosphingobium sp. fls2-241-R2A-195]|uniref:helix-turn-helix transcriptional regulator n=1 Tax=Novosphingobium sp. fls2-241-R2A-195 TaxID=3040296 RepID=UPI00255082C1|nr:helix-turn-helix transcriptional regulator [Novosphingobium sp. fls2-241-R2A-195]
MAFDIGEIYDAAFDRTRFPGLIERLGVAMGAQAGFIGWSDPDRQVGFQFQFGNDPVWLNRYVETYAAQDVLLPHLHAIPEGECQPAWDLLQMPEVRESAFYREYLAPQGIVDNLAVNLIKRPGIVASLALLRRMPSERYTRAECAKLAVLVPHLRRAIYIQSHLVRAQEHAAADRAFAGSAGSSVMLLSAEHVLLEAAPALVPLLRLRIGEPVGEGVLGSAIARTIKHEEPVAVEVVLRDDVSTVRVLLEARRLDTTRFGDLADGPAATFAVHVTRVDLPRAIAFDAIGSLYGLTATELRVLKDAVDTGDITAIGDRQGMARATARTHLHRIYEKTATRSFAGLSSLVHRFGTISPV